MLGLRPTAAALFLLLAAGRVDAFEINGRHWPEQPIPVYINPGSCSPMEDGTTFTDIVEWAVSQWSSVVCADVSFEILGTTTATWDADGQNTFFCVDEGWGFGQGAAGANLWIPTAPGDPPEADIAINAEELIWIPGGPDATQAGMVDPLGVMTHELGHFLGLAHSADPFASMYYAHLPTGIQASLAADDKAGICHLYPGVHTECERDADCGESRVCATIQDIPVCADIHAGPGAFCSKGDLDCDGMCWVSFYECWQVCLFQTADYSEGYCAPLCNDTDCPQGFTCVYAQQQDVNVCFLDETDPDGGPDAGADGADGGIDVETDADGGLDAGSDSAADAPDPGDPGDQADTGPADPGGKPQDDGGPGTDLRDEDSGAGNNGDGCNCQVARPVVSGWLFFLVLGLRRRRSCLK